MIFQCFGKNFQSTENLFCEKKFTFSESGRSSHLGHRQGGRGRERPVFGKIFEIDRENPLHRKKSLKLTVTIWDF
jgi:hypothetical protein